jgi:FkbM family methyltransferase
MGLYDRMKESFAYDCYRCWRFGRPVRWRRRERLLYRSLFGREARQLLIFDIGAHRGQRTALFLGLGARVVAVEPDPRNQRILAGKFLGGFRPRPLTLVPKAVSDTDAGATLWVHEAGSGLNSLSPKWVQTLGADETRFGRRLDFPGRQAVETTTLAALMESFGVPDYIKIDVEGHEPSVLRGLKRPVRFVSFEVNLPEFLPEGIEGIGTLDRLAEPGLFNWYGGWGTGLALPHWLPATAFIAALRECQESSVEVFWQPGPALPAGK